LCKDNLEEVRKSLEHQKTAGKRLKFCWIPGCTEGATNRRVHTMTRHVPEIFDIRVRADQLVQEMRLRALRQASTWLHGRPASLDELVELVNAQRIVVPQTIEQGDEYFNGMMEFCHHAKLSAPESFTLNPLNSAGALIHWKILAILSGMLQEEDREFWIKRFPVPEGYATRENPARQEEPEERGVVDSHFHLDRLMEYAAVGNVQEAIKLGEVEPNRDLKVIAAVANFVDPEKFPTPEFLHTLPSNLMVTIGIHPKAANRSKGFLRSALDKLRQLLEHPRVVGVGEIGLDYSVDASQWPAQLDLLQDLLPMITPNLVLVLHCRSRRGSSGEEVHLQLLSILKDLPREQRIQLHCFSGSPVVLDWWRKKFPNTSFSVNRGVQNFTSEAIKALKMLGTNQLLLETDAPYFAKKGRRYSAPRELFDVAETVAHHRGTTPEEILRSTSSNALQFFSRR